jgi:hypothetical protein
LVNIKIFSNRLNHKQKLEFGDDIECKFWDFNNSLWSSNGCYKVEEESDFFTTVCKCNHLTNFAALMDTSGREKDNLIKSILTYFCSGLSIVGLIITIIIILKPKKVGKRDLRMESNRKLRDIIACNLCICLLIVNILVVSALNRSDIKVKV